MASDNRFALAALALAIIAILISLAAFVNTSSKISSIEDDVSAISEAIEGLEEKIARSPEVQTETVTKTEVETETETVVTERVSLTVIGPWAGDEAKYFQAVLDEYMRRNPNVEIKYVTMRAEDVATALPIQFEAGTSPADVIITPWAWWIVEMAKKGYVEDVSRLIDPADYVQGTVENVMWDGKVWGAPFTMWLKPGFWYKKSFFEQYGLSEPENLDEFMNLLATLSQIEDLKNPIVTGDGVGWPISDVVEHFIINVGGPDLQLALIEGEARFTDPEVRAVFEDYIVPMIENGYFSEPIEWTQAITLWWNGDYALYFMGTWITGMVDDPNDLGFFPLPGAKGVVGGADYIFVPKSAPNKEVALDLLKFLATEGQAVHVSQPAGKIPTWLEVPTEQLWAPMQGVYAKVKELNLQILPDLDDSVGGDWQTLFWDQLKLLWVSPDKLDQVLQTLDQEFPS
ncbi:MAG: ABC transporter substrate-binding protein [Aeropyrum sp.]|nr:ABC transporter substrate-binding protein [Aeropyrum sp.]